MLVIADSSPIHYLLLIEHIEVDVRQPRLTASGTLAELDDGEREAILLAMELEADLLLLDDRRARVEATRQRVATTGTWGYWKQHPCAVSWIYRKRSPVCWKRIFVWTRPLLTISWPVMPGAGGELYDVGNLILLLG